MPRHAETASDPGQSSFGLGRRHLLVEAGSFDIANGATAYESEILAELPGGSETWWRDLRHRFRPDFDGEQAASQLAEAIEFHRHLPEDRRVVLAGLDRQLMARACLRLGSWNLLRSLLGAQLRECRALCPTPYRLSRATGLASEWALAAGLPEPAFAYGEESLSWGTEPHRIQSYLAYAHALQGRDAESPLGELPFLVSFEATLRQRALRERHAFSMLHSLRLRCLRLRVGSHPPDVIGFATIAEDFEALLRIAPPESAPRNLAVLALALATGSPQSLSSDDQLVEAIEFLRETGRWRDLRLLFQADPRRFGDVSSSDLRLTKRLDALVPELALEPPGPVDRDLFALLPGRLETSNPDEARRRFFCCI